MALIHVEGFNLPGIKLLQELETTESQHNFLRQAISLIAAIERVGQCSVIFAVLRQVGIQQINGNRVSGNSGYGVLPGANRNWPSFNFDCGPRSDCGELIFRLPLLWLLELVSCWIQNLTKISFTVCKGNRDNGRAQIRGRAQSISGQNAQTSRIRGDVRLQSDFHGKVRNPRSNRFPHLSFYRLKTARCDPGNVFPECL